LLEALDAFLGINSFEAFFQVLAEGIRQFARFDPAHLIEFCIFMFEFVRTEAVIRHIWLERQCLGDLPVKNEQLRRRRFASFKAG
jgi:hypothetical protein